MFGLLVSMAILIFEVTVKGTWHEDFVVIAKCVEQCRFRFHRYAAWTHRVVRQSAGCCHGFEDGLIWSFSG